jgi:hypothetical protein
MSDKFRYLIFPDYTYLVELTDDNGDKYTAEIRGSEILLILDKLKDII